jgi:hypothetical protein
MTVENQISPQAEQFPSFDNFFLHPQRPDGIEGVVMYDHRNAKKIMITEDKEIVPVGSGRSSGLLGRFKKVEGLSAILEEPQNGGGVIINKEKGTRGQVFEAVFIIEREGVLKTIRAENIKSPLFELKGEQLAIFPVNSGEGIVIAPYNRLQVDHIRKIVCGLVK